MWDNHEFSWQGWQSIQKAGRNRTPGTEHQGRRQPGMVGISARRVARRSSGPSLESFDPPAVTDVRHREWDENGLGDEPNNLAAINSLIGYRYLSLRQTSRPDHHRPTQLSQRRPFQRRLRRRALVRSSPACSRRMRRRFSTAAAPSTAATRRPESSFNGAHVPNPAKGRAAADDPRRRAEGLVQGPAAQIDRDVEDLGQFGRRARLARRPAEPPAWIDKGNLAEDAPMPR